MKAVHKNKKWVPARQGFVCALAGAFGGEKSGSASVHGGFVVIVIVIAVVVVCSAWAQGDQAKRGWEKGQQGPHAQIPRSPAVAGRVAHHCLQVLLALLREQVARHGGAGGRVGRLRPRVGEHGDGAEPDVGAKHLADAARNLRAGAGLVRR